MAKKKSSYNSHNTSDNKTKELEERLGKLKEELELYKSVEKDNEKLNTENKELNEQLEHYRSIEAELETRRAELEDKIKADEANLRQAYRDEEEERLREQREQIEKEKKEILDSANQEAERIISEAQQQAEGILKKAEQKAVNSVASKTKELDEEAKKLAEGKKTLEHEKEQLETRRKNIKKEEKGLALREMEIKDREAGISELWSQCSPGKVEDLNLRITGLNERLESRDNELARLRSENIRLQSLGFAGNGQSVEGILNELEKSRERIRELEDQRENLPSDYEIETLQRKAVEASNLRERVYDLDRKLREAEARAQRNELGNRELQQVKVQADALRTLNDELKRELEQHSKLLEGRSGERFPELVKLDSQQPKPILGNTTRSVDLKSLAEHVRLYAATRTTPLYYTETTIRAFIAGLASAQLSILQGLSGTGKTSLPRVFAEAVGGHYRIIPVQSGWRDRHELLGYHNDFSKRFSESEFTKAVYEGGLPGNEGKIWFIILDELNLARIEYYFADFLSILEEPNPDNWLVSLMSYDPRTQMSNGSNGPRHLIEGHKLRIPQNMWFIGTANQDESTFEITDKVYDRAQSIEFVERQKMFDVTRKVASLPISSIALRAAFDNAIKKHSETMDNEMWGAIELLDQTIATDFQITFGNRIRDQIKSFVPVYIATGGTLDEAIDFQFARKVLRKLEKRHDPGLIDSLRKLRTDIRDAFPGKRFTESQSWIDRRIRAFGGEAE